MGWSLTAPTLPSGSSWVQKDTIRISNNQLDVTGTLYFARLKDTGFALKLVEKRSFHLTNPNFTDFYKTYHRCDVAGVTGTAYTENDFGDSGSTKTYYFTGTAAAGATIYVLVGVKVDNSTDSSTFTAPALLVTSLTISFDAQGGSACSAITRNKGATYGTLPTTTRRYYKFLGWSTTTSSSNIVSSTTTITQSANFTLYAIWQFIGAVYVKANGAWKYSPALYIKINGKWI